ncbi:MAG: hypothetical protein ACLR7N_01230 [Roseburia hominis]
MDIKERLSFFQEMVQCEYPLHLWHYSPEFELIETDCPAELMLPDIISMLGFSSLVLAHIESGNRMPLILDTEFGLLWIAGFEYQGFALQQIHIVGPAFTGSNSHLVLRKKLDSYQLTVKLRSKIVKQIESVPIIPSSVLLSYAIMFHCAITGERITADLISFTSHSTTGVPDDSPLSLRGASGHLDGGTDISLHDPRGKSGIQKGSCKIHDLKLRHQGRDRRFTPHEQK